MCVCIGLSFPTCHSHQARWYECCCIPTRQVITQIYITVVPTTPTLIATINTLGKSDGIEHLKITNLHGHFLFDSMDPALMKTIPCRSARQ